MRAIRLSLLLLAVASPVSAQQILFDNPVRAGDLVMFRDINDEKAYYYAPTRPRLATDANGLPQFSFFRWVENVRSGAGAADAREGEGGGIVHVLVTFGVTREALTEADRDLKRQVPGARIAGPIVPKEGTFTLVSSTMKSRTEADGQFATRVLGVGKAPILDGDKAAVSITLTKLGAKILWEQFQTPTPDISFEFEMTVDGFKGPIRATIEANLDEVVKHDSFAAGIAGNFFGAEIKGAFDELRRTNVIKVTQIGEDAKFAEIIKSAYDKLVELLFDKTSPAAAAAAVAPAGGGAGGTQADSWLTRATTQLGAARTAADAAEEKNNQIRKRNAERQAKRDLAAAAEKRADDLEKQIRDAESAASQPATGQPRAEAAAATMPPTGTTTATTGTATTPPATGTTTPAVTPPAAPSHADNTQLRTKAEAARAEAITKRQDATKEGPDEPLKDVPAEPGFAIMGTYQLKRSRTTGIYRIDLNKHTADTRVFRFDENVGDLRALYKSGHFRQVNLDDPLYKQREIVAIIDGVNAEDFGQYVNFVSLRLRKQHESGELTDDEIRIDRKTFNQEGASFKMLYGWKGDNNRKQWMDYEYQAVWSFFGGHTIEMPWKKWSANEIPLSPPLQRRSVELQGDPKRLAEQGARAVSVKIFYRASQDAPEQVKQVTLNAAAPTFVGRIDFVGPGDSVDYEYEITWQLTGNRTRTTGRRPASTSILYVDEVPAN
jgi:hypothetical protein